MDTNKLKAGDAVEGKLEQDLKEDGQMIAPKNSRLVGRILEVTSREHGDAVTRLAFLFNRAVAKDGQGSPLCGILFDVLAADSADDDIARMQQFHLDRMRDAANRGDAYSDVSTSLAELYNNANTTRPTAASQQYDCQKGTVAGEVWCAPRGHTVMAHPTGVGGLDGVLLQKEKTPLGPIGVLISPRKNIVVNRGVDLLIYFLPQR